MWETEHFWAGSCTGTGTTLMRQATAASRTRPKQAQYVFDDLLSSILFITNYVLPINEPATY